MSDLLKMIADTFVNRSRKILGDNLVGIYLHGSAAMGCFNDKKSDIDLLTVVSDTPSGAVKLRYMDMVTALNASAPPKGIEFSMLRRAVCRPFVYPTPFELHFSATHLMWYRRDPRDYISKMNGTDRDLAAHIMITRHRGQCLWGEAIQSVFEDVGEKAYLDSIWRDIEHAGEDILETPVYTALNLCRVLAYKREKLILSKQEGGQWGLKNLPESCGRLIRKALDDYASAEEAAFDECELRSYAEYMMQAITAR